VAVVPSLSRAAAAHPIKSVDATRAAIFAINENFRILANQRQTTVDAARQSVDGDLPRLVRTSWVADPTDRYLPR